MSNKIFTDIQCPKCKTNKTKVWGHVDLHLNTSRVCVNCKYINHLQRAK